MSGKHLGILAAVVTFGTVVSLPIAFRDRFRPALRESALEEKLVGKWNPTGEGTFSVEFFGDRSFAIKGRPDDLAGTWSMVAPDRVKMTGRIFGTDFIKTFESVQVSGDQMACRSEGVALRFLR